MCQPSKKWFRHGNGVLPFADPSSCLQPLVYLGPARSGLRQAHDNGGPSWRPPCATMPSRRRPFLGCLLLADQTFNSKEREHNDPTGDPPLRGVSRAGSLPTPPDLGFLEEKQDACASPTRDRPSRSPQSLWRVWPSCPRRRLALESWTQSTKQSD